MGITMKILHAVWNFFEQLAVVRAAGILARQGRKQEAIDLVSSAKII
jgi:hypothetical protein